MKKSKKLILILLVISFILIHVFNYINYIKNTPRLYVIISSNIDDIQKHYYTFYLPIVSLAWRQLNFIPICLLISSNHSNVNILSQTTIDFLKQINVKIINVSSIKGYESTASKLSRIFCGLIDEKLINNEDYILISDADLIPFNKQYYEIEDYDSIKIWGSECCGSFILNGKIIKMYPMSHIGMKKSTWKRVMNLNESIKFNLNQIDYRFVLKKVIQVFKDVSLIRKNLLAIKNDSWYLDQKMISAAIQQVDKSINIIEQEYDGIRLGRKQNINLKELKQNFHKYTDFYAYHEDLFEKWINLENILKIMLNENDNNFIKRYFNKYKTVYDKII